MNAFAALGTAILNGISSLDPGALPTPDPSARRSYIEDGMIRNIRPRLTEVLLQEPNVTLLCKKRQFSSLADNYNYNLMDADEKLFVKATKILFDNKCKAIAAYEQLTNIQNIIINSGGAINDTLLPAITSSSDTLSGLLGPNFFDGATQSALQLIKQVKQFSDPSPITTWLADQTPFNSDTGVGTGVFELTNVQSLSCTNTVQFMGGRADFTIEDPYKLMLVSNDDIEQAISTASNAYIQSSFYQLTEQTLNNSISNFQSQLNGTRTGRGASTISFVINDSSFLYNKVQAIVDNTATPISFSFNGGLLGIGSSVSIDASSMQGANGLQNQEVDLFQQIIQNVYSLLGLQDSANSGIFQSNVKTNYVRQRMKLEFANKPIIQPMDVIHIFISSKTITDSQLTQGFNTSFSGALTQLNANISNIQSSYASLATAFGGNSGGGAYAEEEKNAIAGPNFPLWLWLLMRNDFTRQAAGTHVFAGIVEIASHSYSDGKYTLKVSVKDNANYFDFNVINEKPSVDTFDSSLYDPLTPFNLNFDVATGFATGGTPQLLDENVSLFLSNSAKAKSGRFRGSIIDQDSWGIVDAEKVASNVFRRKLNDPDGFVYKWKKGIGSLTLFGEPHAAGNFKSEAAPTLTKDPFAGQDVMNVLSLLITNQPYNFNTFIKASLASGALNKDSLANNNGAQSFFKGLINDLIKTNQSWGNFIPFKKLIVNQSSYQFLLSGQFDITNANNQVTQLLQQRASAFDELTSILPQLANNPQFYRAGSPINTSSLAGININSISTLGTNIIKLDAQIQAQTQSLETSLNNPSTRSADGTLKIFGNDVSFDSAPSNGISSTQTAQNQSDLRKQINYLTQRRLWKVKANEDQNLFIVDDSYDKNYDIQAFEAAISGALETFKSTYSKVSDVISRTKDLLGLEVFADSQGHIQARPPQYNRMPSSVFNNMINGKSTKGIQIFPAYLESLFVGQVDGLVKQLQIDEDQIRIRAAVLGYTTDDDAKMLLRGALSGGGASNVNFSFVTDPNTGTIGGKDIRILLAQSNPDNMEDNTKQALGALTTAISAPINATANFDIVQRVSIVNSPGFAGLGNNLSNDAVTAIGLRLQQETSQSPPTRQTLLPNSGGAAVPSQLDVLNLTTQIAQFVSDRQGIIRSLAGAIKNLDQGLALNKTATSSSEGANILFPNLASLSPKTIPSIIEHMIEDETYDDLGTDSGKRFVITDSNIISFSITETPPPYTIIEVDGEIASGLVSGPSGLEVGQGGNGISAAFAADYDMWRMYGFRGAHNIPIHMLSSPEGQCAPYAVFMLNQARKNIFKAQLSSIGNEFIQAGEVYYVEDYDLLFYAEAVTHNFTYGQGYTTSMSLTYGHNPGEYIPTMLDIIGKGLYTNRSQSNSVRHVRNDNSNNDTALTVIVNDPNVPVTSFNQLFAGSYGKQNIQNLTNLAASIVGVLANTTYGDQATVELRTYFNSKMGFSSADPGLTSIANYVLSWIKTPSQSNNDGSTIIPANNIPKGLDVSKISVVAVDIGSTTDVRSSPSSQAWSVARSIAATGSLPIAAPGVQASLGIMQQMAALFTNVLDIWAVFAPATTGTVSGGNSSAAPGNQADLDSQEQYISNFNKSLGINGGT
jgi:hypothetical protein